MISEPIPVFRSIPAKLGTKFPFVQTFSECIFGIFGMWSENFAFGRNFGFVPKFSERVPEPKAKILFWTITAWVCFHALHCSKLVHWFRNEFWFSVLFGPKLGTKFQFVLKFSECVFGIFGTWSENFVSTHHYLSLLSYVAKNLNQRNILTPVGTQSENFILTHHCHHCVHALHCNKLAHWFRNELRFSVPFRPKFGTEFQFVWKFLERKFGIFGMRTENFVSTHHYLSLLS